MVGTLIGQALPVLFSPILTRLYSPAEFGTFGLFTSFITIFIGIITLRYDLTIVLPKKNTDSIVLLDISIIASLLGMILLYVILFSFGKYISSFIKNDEISSWYFAIPLVIFFGGIIRSFTYLTVRQKRFYLNAKGKAVQTIFTVLIAVLYGIGKLKHNGLIISSSIGYFVGFLYYQLFLGKYMIKVPIFRGKVLINLAKEYSDYPKYNTIPSLLNNIVNLIPLVFISRYFNAQILGFFSLSFRVVYLPLNLIATSLTQVLTEKISSLYKLGKGFVSYNIKIGLSLFALGIIPVLILVFWGQGIFSFLFGKEWTVAGQMTRIIIIPFFIRFIVIPLSCAFASSNNIRISSKWQWAYFISSTILFILFTYLHNIFNILIIYSIHDVIFYVIYFILILRLKSEPVSS